jgi:hypothetical protein
MTLALAALLAAGPALAFAPEPGDVIVYERRQVFTDPKDGFVMDLTDRMTVRVTQRDTAGRFGYSVRIQPVRTVIDGVARSFGPEEQGTAFTETRDGAGALLSRSDAPLSPEFHHRLANVVTVPAPQGADGAVAGRTWTADLSREDWPKVRSRVTVERVEPAIRPERARVRVENRETDVDRPLVASGRAVMRLDTGWLVELDLRVSNAIIPGGDGEPVDLVYRLRALEVRLVPDRARPAR